MLAELHVRQRCGNYENDWACGLMFRKILDASNDTLTIYIDGVEVTAQESESVAAVLLRQNPAWNRSTPVSGERRAPFCMMGVCFDCLAIVDGVASTQTCLVRVRDGMKVERQHGKPELWS